MLYTARKAYERLNRSVGINKIRKLMKSGEIVSFVEGGKYVTTETNLDNYWKKKIVIAELEAERKKKWLSKN